MLRSRNTARRVGSAPKWSVYFAEPPKLDFNGFSCCERPKWRNTALLGEFCAHLTTSRAAQNSSRALYCAIWPLSRDEKIAKVEPKSGLDDRTSDPAGTGSTRTDGIASALQLF